MLPCYNALCYGVNYTITYFFGGYNIQMHLVSRFGSCEAIDFGGGCCASFGAFRFGAGAEDHFLIGSIFLLRLGGHGERQCPPSPVA